MTLYRLPRLRNVAIPFLFAFVTLLVFAGHAHAADIDPVGIGDLMPSPDSTVPKGGGTLYETYSNPNLWELDSDFGTWDVLDPMGEMIADICMGLISVIGSACVVIVQWIFQLTSIPALSDVITKSIGAASKGLTETLLPTALAVGALVAFAQHKRGGGGGGMSQLAWVAVSGVVSISLLTSPGTWVSGVDSARQIGAGIALNATSDGLGNGTTSFPFKLDHDPKWTGNGRDDMLRKSSDAVWRAYVATPWCVAEFGSFEVCQKYGKDLLDQGSDKDKRKEWLQDNVTSEAVGDASVKWRQGHSPVGRIMVTVPALISVIIFAALILMLAFTSLAALIGCLLLLLTGVFFACLWAIPGKPRNWGLAWFDQLIGKTLESTIATLVLGGVLTLQTATTQMFGSYGWAPSAGLSIAAAVVGVKFRSTVAQIFGVATSSPGGQLAGFLAGRALNKAMGGRGRRRRDHHYQPVRTLPSRGGGGGRHSGSGGGGGGGGGGALPPGPGGNSDGYDVTLTRVPQRPPAPKPLPASDWGPALPAGTGHAAIPPQSARQRPALPSDGQRTATPAGSRPAIAQAPKNPGPQLRPEAATPNYAFRQAPPPAAPGQPGPKVIQATVIRSTPNGPPPRPAGTQTPPPRPAAPSPSPAPRPSTPPKG